MIRENKKIAFVSLGILVFCTISLMVLVRMGISDDLLRISFLNVGQGDAIFIEAPNGKQILMDGGPDSSVLKELGRVMPSFDRAIDAVVITNPDKDHIGGFIEVLQRYKVDYLVEPGTVSNTDTYKAVRNLSKSKELEEVVARRGMAIVLDESRNIYLHILFPDKDVKDMSTNDGSIISKLVYADTSVMLQGDSPQNMERYLMALNQGELDSDILKVGHHGSRTSTDKNYVEVVSPLYAVISLGNGNRYGHPHKETTETLVTLGVPTLRTDVDGRITFESNGTRWERKD